MILGGILDGLFSGIVSLVIQGINGLIAAIGAVLSGLFAALPSMPALPSPPTALTTAEAWVAWVFPVSTMIDALAFVLSMWLLWVVVAIALRWAKAGSSDL